MVREVHWQHVGATRTHLEELVERVVGWMVYRGIGRVWLEPYLYSFTGFTGCHYVTNDPFD